MFDKIEKAFPGLRMCGKTRIDSAASRWKAEIQVPLMTRLSREGMVALGDVFVPCVAIADVPVPGRKPVFADILVMDHAGKVSIIVCALQARGAIIQAAARLSDIDRRLGSAVGDPDDLENLYRKAKPRGHERETLVQLVTSASDEMTPRFIEGLPPRWAECIASRRPALYLAMDRRPEDLPAAPKEPIAPVVGILESRSGGMFEVVPPAASPRDPAKYMGCLEEPARTIWIFRRKIG